ncbi:hypothetical protein Droror1_Dr00010272 [Drosera rotundifolia]
MVINAVNLDLISCLFFDTNQSITHTILDVSYFGSNNLVFGSPSRCELLRLPITSMIASFYSTVLTDARHPAFILLLVASLFIMHVMEGRGGYEIQQNAHENRTEWGIMLCK